jgi:hypothetical protein
MRGSVKQAVSIPAVYMYKEGVEKEDWWWYLIAAAEVCTSLLDPSNRPWHSLVCVRVSPSSEPAFGRYTKSSDIPTIGRGNKFHLVDSSRVAAQWRMVLSVSIGIARLALSFGLECRRYKRENHGGCDD